MGISYFYKWENVDTSACSGCQFFKPGKKGYKYYCDSKGDGSNDTKESSETLMECSEWGVNSSVNSEVAQKSKDKGIMGKLASKAGGEVKKAAMRDVNTLKRNLGKMI